MDLALARGARHHGDRSHHDASAPGADGRLRAWVSRHRRNRAARSPDASLWQLALFWALSNGPPTVLLLAFVTRRVRAVGPLVLLFTIVAVLGSQVLVSAVGATDTGMRAVVRMGVAVGLHATAMLMTIAALGFASFGVLGWLALRAIGRSYQRRGMSDQSLMVAAMWMLFAVTGSIGLVFEGVAWGLTSVVAVVPVY